MTTWIPFFWSIDVLLGAFVLILLSIYDKDFSARIEKVRVELRDKLHWAMSQSLKRGAA